ncbi:DUF456 domain-containing protein [Accumulibacter sp.]|uniref:DUF456 domain-containing protein n=1 Tax=Accumulibacter sp. TaxID=2053492 RepID=UPI0025F329AD|nr:DUF456 domain-containing protein [Accumulibacter sp.]MCM8594603.1 DUF456 domain-containing protein [Accumulibacter sp.]MCM8627240.1 DUF456 domain-containing protein [Accumulibacter sp.]MDS4048749.1 DUF456 domain-containing protein [Accumulibacter sp.]
MNELLWILAWASMLLGLLGVFLPLLPGVPLLFGGMLLAAWIDGFTRVGAWTLVALGVMTAAAWLVEMLASVWGVKRVGASGLAMAGAGVGAIVGILGGVPGVILGPIVGAVCGEYIARRNERAAARAGIAAGIGFLVAIVAKLAIAVTMLAVFALAWFA